MRFEKERINSLSEDGELMLTLLASFAQEESVSISENCKWGIRRTYQNGTDGVRQKRLLGYRYDGEKYVIVPDEAEAVKYIYKRYLEGAGYKTISDELAVKNVRSWRGFVMPMYSIKYILSNEIYVGDRLLQKVYIKDPIKKIKVKNRGELPQYLIQNCHEPIIDRETFNAVQAEHKKRVDGINITAFSKKIKCAECGRYYTRKTRYVRQWSYVDWFCRTKKEGGNCDSGYLQEKRLKTITTKLLGWNEFDDEKFEEQVQVIIADKKGNLIFRLYDGSEIEWRDMLKGRNDGIDRNECFKGKIFCGCCGVEYHRSNSANKWISWYCAAKKRRATMHDKHSINYNESDLARIAAHILGTEMLDEAMFKEQVQRIVVLESGDVRFDFKDGSTKLWERM